MHRLQRVRVSLSAASARAGVFAYCALIGFLALYAGAMLPSSHLQSRYESLFGTVWRDRNDAMLPFLPNARGDFMAPAENVPPLFEKLLLRKEDRYFYYHVGINPISALRGVVSFARTGTARGGSTITQQLVKILLENENDRTVGNKFIESLYALALELHTSKRDILAMYENAVHFGRNRQGVVEASSYFFGKKPMELSESEMIQLIAALGAPTSSFPGSRKNTVRLPLVAAAAGSELVYATSSGFAAPSRASLPPAPFELKTLGLSCNPCDLTIDASLTERIRGALRAHIDSASKANVHNGAVVVIKIPENELLALIGSPNPSATTEGAQLVMALEPRPIGSTAKPFIYLSAFMNGARPYTLVEDREYRYTIGTGFAFYPKNFDGKFRGMVTLHNALSNSLNVPAVKVLEYAGLPRFYAFLQDSLGFTPRQPLQSYELGIALGALEMDLLTLSHFFTIFPNKGVLKPLTLEAARPGEFQAPMEKKSTGEMRLADEAFVQLVNKILSDRETAVEQFGLRSNLTLPHKNYALKTGTSRDYHDSWVVGFTPDFLVGVWLGNSDNTPMREVTGQNGAGAVFEDVMALMYASPYNHDTQFSFDKLEEFTESGSIEYGLPGDDYDAARGLLTQSSLIVSPHDGDTIEFSEDTTIPLNARETVDWFIDGIFLARAKEASWSPTRDGPLLIKAEGNYQTESIHIFLAREKY